MPEQQKNDWKRAYADSVQREKDLTEATPGYSEDRFLWNLRVLVLAGGLTAAAVAFTGRALGVQGMGLFWVALGAAVVVGSVIWWRHS